MSENITDIVARLRGLKWKTHCEMRGLVDDATAYEAADTIEALLKKLEYARDDAIEECAMKVREVWLEGEPYAECEDSVRALKGKS